MTRSPHRDSPDERELSKANRDELAIIRRALQVSAGEFSLSVATCNSRKLRNQLVRVLEKRVPGLRIVSLPDEDAAVVRLVEENVASSTPDALLVLNFDGVVRNDSDAIRKLNASRELWEGFSFPLVFWMDEETAGLIARTAPDFWRYFSHQSRFVQPPPKRAPPKNGAAYRVFISSTYLDNEDRRGTVEDAIIVAGMLPIGMERFTAATRPTVEECVRLAREADVLVGIVAWRYGWIPKGRKKSITELEYEANPERLMFQLDDGVPIDPKKDMDSDPSKFVKLAAFKSRFSEDQMPARFQDVTLGVRVLTALQRWKADHEPNELLEAQPSPPTPAVTPALPDDALSRYLAKIAEMNGSIPVAGYETRVQVPIRMDDLFVPLDAIVNTAALQGASIGDAEEAEKHFEGRRDQSRIPLSEAFWRAEAHHHRRGLVILGDPGSGKTTHMKRLVLWLARGDPTELGLPPDMVPVFLPLRKLTDPDTDLRSFALAELSDPMLEVPAGFGERLLRTDRLLFLIDGLDEVADPDARARVSAWIEEGLKHYPGSRFVVTCRYAGYQGEARLSGEFLELHLRQMNREQAETFIQNWFRTVESCVTDDKDLAERRGKEKADELIERLRQPDFRSSRVFELTRNPLLLTGICIVHMDRGRLPHRRAELYRECTNVLLERWRTAKKLPVAVSAVQGRQVLQPVAYWLHRKDGRTRAHVDELAPVIEPSLVEVKIRNLSGAAFLATIRDESGLLTGWSDKTFGFLHLGFQEYLAAREIARRSSKEPEILAELAAHFGESWWREVTLLLLSLEDSSMFEPFMRHAVQQPAFATDAQLVSDCIEDAVRVSTAPFAELMERDAGEDSELLARQVVAHRLLVQIEPDKEWGPVPGTTDERRSGTSDRVVFTQEVQDTLIAGPAQIELVTIPAGTFLMGTPEADDQADDDERPVHKVTVPAFQLATVPVTNEQYGRFLAAAPDAAEPEYWADRRYNAPGQPVVGVSWNDAQAFCAWAGLRLPSESEWEYACRAKTTTRYWSGDEETDLARVGWYDENSESRLHVVGEKPANPWGLHDMHGNVWEWCEDSAYGDYESTPTDGTAWVDQASEFRVFRGGSFDYSAWGARSAVRFGGEPGDRWSNLGFRPARSVTAD